MNSTNKKIAMFPGSFDPLTRGHVDIANRSLEIFDGLFIAVMDNPLKSKSYFSVEERISLIREEFRDFGDRVEVGTFSGLLVEYMRSNNITVVVRGLRAISDFDYEAQMALMNKQLDSKVETLFMVAREVNSYISSTLVKQIAPLGGDVSRLVTPIVLEAIKRKYGNNDDK